MPQTKTKKKKGAAKAIEPAEESPLRLDDSVVLKKAGKMHEAVEDHDDLFVTEPKPDDEVPIVAEEAEDPTTEEASLDEEDINPFGDKWEQ